MNLASQCQRLVPAAGLHQGVKVQQVGAAAGLRTGSADLAAVLLEEADRSGPVLLKHIGQAAENQGFQPARGFHARVVEQLAEFAARLLVLAGAAGGQAGEKAQVGAQRRIQPGIRQRFGEQGGGTFKLAQAHLADSGQRPHPAGGLLGAFQAAIVVEKALERLQGGRPVLPVVSRFTAGEQFGGRWGRILAVNNRQQPQCQCDPSGDLGIHQTL